MASKEKRRNARLTALKIFVILSLSFIDYGILNATSCTLIDKIYVVHAIDNWHARFLTEY